MRVTSLSIESFTLPLHCLPFSRPSAQLLPTLSSCGELVKPSNRYRDSPGDRPSLCGRALGPAVGANAYRGVLDSIRHYLDEMEVPRPMIEAMVATGSAEIKWVDAGDDLKRPPSLAEWEDATCGNFSIKDENLLSDLRTKRPSLAQREQDLRDQLQNRKSQWTQCRIELLSSNRDKLSAP